MWVKMKKFIELVSEDQELTNVVWIYMFRHPGLYLSLDVIKCFEDPDFNKDTKQALQRLFESQNIEKSKDLDKEDLVYMSRISKKLEFVFKESWIDLK